MPIINFFVEDISFTLKNKILLKKWIKATIKEEGSNLDELNFIFCSDNYLLHINRQYLKHDTYTDIVTFDNSEADHSIAGDIFISVDRVKENALQFKVLPQIELYRVIIHGVLHLLGYRDKKTDDKKIMTLKEDYYLASNPLIG